MNRRTEHVTSPVLLALLGALSSCGGGLANPVLLLNLTGIPQCSAMLQVTVSAGGRSAAPLSFYRDANNVFKDLSMMTGSLQGAAPASASVAVDLPAETRGTVMVTVSARWPGMTMPPPPPSQWPEVTRAADSVAIDGAKIVTRAIQLPPDAMICPTGPQR